jgi:uncharacterized membrane protein
MRLHHRIARGRARLLAFKRDDRGGIAIIASAFFMVGIACSALAIDIGSLYLEKRNAQSITDLAAMAAAGDLAHAEAAARATLVANNIDIAAATVKVDLGNYDPKLATAVNARFTAGALPYNAARVTVTKPGRIFFAKTFTDNCCTMSVTAMSANAQLATFSIGSRLAGLSGGVINGLLGGLLGGTVNLSLMDYNALASANVGLFDFAKALSTELGLTGASYSDVLSASANVGNVINALAKVTQNNGNTTASTALKTLLLQSNAGSTPITLSKLLSLGPVGSTGVGDPISGPNPQISVMDIVSAAATIANGGKMVDLNLGASIPGVANLRLSVAIGEPAQQSGWVAVGQPGATLHTAQMRVRLEAKIGGSGLLSAAQVRLPIYINSATADGTLTNIACAADGTGAVTVAAKPGLASAAIGEVSDAALQNFAAVPPATPAKLVDVSLPVPLLPPIGLQVYGSASTSVTNTSATNLVFSQTDINNGTIKRASTRNMSETLVSSLLSGLSVTVAPLGLSVTVDPLVKTILTGVAVPLDQVLYTLLTTLGIRLGEVDVRVHGVSCRSSVLAG